MADDFHDDLAMRQMEATVRAAGDYVCPSEDLRPRTIEAARDVCEDRRVRRKMGGVAIATVVVFVLSAPIVDYLSAQRDSLTGPSAAEMQEQAIELGAQEKVGPEWGLYEAFSRLRRIQADRLRPATAAGILD